MNRHRFDPISFVLGVAIIVAGIAASSGTLGRLLDGNRPADLAPIIVLLIGAVVMAGAARRLTRSESPRPVSADHHNTADNDE